MPFFRLETNVSIKESDRQPLVEKTSKFISRIVGKPETYVMVLIHDGVSVSFAGSSEPAALVSLGSIGLQKEQCASLSEQICNFLDSELGVPGHRTYIEFRDLERSMFGWDGRTF